MQVVDQPGATVFCTVKNNKKCNMAYHFPCAYASKRVHFGSNIEIVCEVCCPKWKMTPRFPLKIKSIKRRI